MKWLTVFLALLIAPSAQAGQPAVSPLASQSIAPERLDHALMWSRDIDRTTAALAVKLGFQVLPGGDFGDGVANRTIHFANGSYLELLYFSRPEDQLRPDVATSYRFLARHIGANNFAMLASAIAARLARQGFQLAPAPPPASIPMATVRRRRVRGRGEPSNSSIRRSAAATCSSFAIHPERRCH